MTEPEQPRWLSGVARMLPIRSQFVISSNIRSTFFAGVSGQTALGPLLRTRYNELLPSL